MGNARNLARILADSSGAIAIANLGNAPNPILPGTIAFLGMNVAPTGWLKANGAALSRTSYASLFAAIGTTYGAGNGSTTFNLPDLRGEFLRAWDDGRGVDTGRGLGGFQNNATEWHSHHMGTNATCGMKYYSGSFDVIVWGGPGMGYSDRYTAGQSSGNAAGETRPRNIALLACIKY